MYSRSAETRVEQFAVGASAARKALDWEPTHAMVDPYSRGDTPAERPTFGLDDGETDVIVLANALGVDGVLTDEFGGTNVALVHAALRGERVVPTPRLLCEYARNGHVTAEEARALLDTISPHRSWENSPYVAQLRASLD